MMNAAAGLKPTPIYEALADAFLAEGVSTLFALTGDGNMHWEAAISSRPGVTTLHVRHEHCACAMATAWAAMTGEVGVASVTCGPGVTQIVTALATAQEARIPLVVFAGEPPLHARWYNQFIDQAPVVASSGAHYIEAHSANRLLFDVAQAFAIARAERRPVVIGVPLDLQKQRADLGAYVPSRAFLPDNGPRVPHPEAVARAAERIAAASRIVVLAGRGARASGAQAACARLAELCNGALSATLPVRGLFAGNERYIGFSGGFTHPATRAAFGEADLVIAVGASLANHASDANALFAPGDVIQIDDDPAPIKHGQRPAGMVLCADAALGVAALLAALEGRGLAKGDWGVKEHARRLLSDPMDARPWPREPGLLDPRDAIRALDAALPPDLPMVNSAGHCSYFAAHLPRRSAEDFLVIREFGVIGNALSYGIGAALARPGRPVAVIEGDGGLMMHVQELETLRRYGPKVLLCIFNDGAYGSEIHKLRAEGLGDGGAIYGRADLAALARGFGLRAATLTREDQFAAAMEEFAAGDGAMLWDIHVSDRVMSPKMRAAIGLDG